MNGWDLFTYLMVGTLFISAILIFIVARLVYTPNPMGGGVADKDPAFLVEEDDVVPTTESCHGGRAAVT